MTDFLWMAIKKLKPSSEFTYTENDYASINWIVLEGEAPTEEEIANAIEEVKQEKLQDEAQAASKRQALLEKLGITEEEAKLLLS